MWREPSKSEAPKTALEKDPSAAARSSIRRGPSRLSSRVRRADVLSSYQSQLIDELRRNAADTRRLELRVNAADTRRVPRFSFIPPSGAIENAVALEQAEREALSWAQSRAASAPRQTQTETETDRQREAVNRRYRTNRDQPFTDILGRMSDQYRNTHASPSLTPNFAPALAYHTSTSSNSSDSAVRLPPMRDRYNTDLPSNTPSSLDIPEHQSRNTQTRPTRDPIIDGLGDRQRSPSPDGERETDAWETLLSTITPDATLPSTDTSFNSTSAATPDISRNPRPRSSVNLRQPIVAQVARGLFRLDPDEHLLNPCDFSSSDDDDQEYMERAVMRYASQNSTMSNHPPIRTPTIIPASILALSDGQNQGRLSHSDRHHQNDDLHHMQVILDRLARREDIPVDWWAAAGLARTLDRGLNASTSMDSTDTEGASGTNRDS
ncbi:uncharacterized protein N7479_003376 [Penicillium vulpinum]|uniref:uncharacterized protein n=1 Tax=Penicillium vulpinum TaxID=29845 RepID=UPI002547C85B|nr:uncharacterized protein N7479_003376 [Penicillium vulpinum]KAJ5963500.1 hypothetical protein N7479_003376 [Penicillium vulpinum]